VILDSLAGGGGASGASDGIDTGGPITAIAAGIANVETNEYAYPILYLYRRDVTDTGGPGEHRGGVGIEYAFVPHRTEAPLRVIMFGHGIEQPASSGIVGGYPGGTGRFEVVRGVPVADLMRSGVDVSDVHALGGIAERMPPMADTNLGPVDIFAMRAPGGGGYGDPLARDPHRVLSDVRDGFVSPRQARRAYGVVIHNDAVSETETIRLRHRLFSLRRDRARITRVPGEQAGRGFSIDVQHGTIRCGKCGFELAGLASDFKLAAVVRERHLSMGRRRRVHETRSPYVLREFSCPACGGMLDVELNVSGRPPIPEFRLVEPV
jgi:N-methylhydantoinase B